METRLSRPFLEVPTPHVMSIPKIYSPSNKLVRQSTPSQEHPVFPDSAGIARYV